MTDLQQISHPSLNIKVEANPKEKFELNNLRRCQKLYLDCAFVRRRFSSRSRGTDNCREILQNSFRSDLGDSDLNCWICGEEYKLERWSKVLGTMQLEHHERMHFASEQNLGM